MLRPGPPRGSDRIEPIRTCQFNAEDTSFASGQGRPSDPLSLPAMDATDQILPF